MSRLKGSPKTGGRKKGSKNTATLLKEERRAIFDEEVSLRWKDTIAALKPEYVADQFMGKAPDKVEHEIKVKSSEDKEKISNAIKGITGKPTGTN